MCSNYRLTYLYLIITFIFTRICGNSSFYSFPFSYDDYCIYPRWVIQSLIAFMLSLITLFSNFYYQTYYKKSRVQSHTHSPKRQRSRLGDTSANVKEPRGAKVQTRADGADMILQHRSPPVVALME